VRLVARGAHPEAIHREGLEFIESDGTRRRVCEVAASDGPAHLGVQDLVVLGVKAR
jgi:ketopantoate reductase